MSTPTNPAEHDVDARTDSAAVHGDSTETVESHGDSAADGAALEGAVDQLDDVSIGDQPLR